MVDLFATNLMHLERINSHDDEIGYNSNGVNYDEDDDEEDGINPIKHYKNIIRTSENATVNDDIRFRNYRDKDLRFGNEYSLNRPWKR